jgi:hypothetical protein
MKINEVISEAAPINLVPWSPSNPSLRGPSSQIRAPAKGSTGRVVQAGRIGTKKLTRFLASTRYRPYITSKSALLRNSTKLLRIWQFLGFGEMILDYFDQRAALEIMKGLPPKDESYISQEEYDTNIRQASEALVVSILAAEAFPRLIQGLRLTKWVISIIGVAGTAASWGATLAAFIASEVAMIAFQRWLISPEGKKAVAYLVAWCIDPVLTWLYPDSLVNKIKELVGMDTKKPDDKKPDVPADKKPDVPADKKPDSGQASQPERKDSTIPTPNVAPSYKGDPNELTKRTPMPFT